MGIDGGLEGSSKRRDKGKGWENEVDVRIVYVR
jgi:hypothetical protein